MGPSETTASAEGRLPAAIALKVVRFWCLMNTSSWNWDTSNLLFHTEDRTAALRKKPGFCVLGCPSYKAGNPGSSVIIQDRFQVVSVLACGFWSSLFPVFLRKGQMGV